MFTRVKFATKPARVNHATIWQRSNPARRTQISEASRVKA